MSTLNEIATCAAHFGFKTNKKAAYELLIKLIKQEETRIESGGELFLQLVKLYSFFSPPPGKLKTPFQWVNMAVDKKGKRYNLRHVYVEDGTMIATDGHRLHRLPTDLDNGFYDKNSVRIEVDASFPNYHRVIPEMKGERHTWTRAGCDVIAAHSANTTEIYKLPNGDTVNKKYWDAATLGEDSIDFYQDEKYGPVRIVFEDPDKIAVVMPGRW